MAVFYIVLYLIAIVIANSIIAYFGPSASIVTALVFIGLDLTVRDVLHDYWQGKRLWFFMGALILSGSVLSYVLNSATQNIAIASCSAFLLAGGVDAVLYQVLKGHSKIIRVNGSNFLSAAVDSLIFPALAFGFPLLWGVVIGQFVAKLLGGFVWYFILHGCRK